MTLCREFKRKGKNDYGKNEIQKQKGTHLQRKSGRQFMLSVIISMKMAKETMQRRLTGCYKAKSTGSVLKLVDVIEEKI